MTVIINYNKNKNKTITVPSLPQCFRAPEQDPSFAVASRKTSLIVPTSLPPSSSLRLLRPFLYKSRTPERSQYAYLRLPGTFYQPTMLLTAHPPLQAPLGHRFDSTECKSLYP